MCDVLSIICAAIAVTAIMFLSWILCVCVVWVYSQWKYDGSMRKSANGGAEFAIEQVVF
jgi:hypothetical protein